MSQEVEKLVPEKEFDYMIPSVSIDGSLAEIIDQNCQKFPQDSEKRHIACLEKKYSKHGEKMKYIFLGGCEKE